MKKIAFISLFVAGALFAGCDEDFNIDVAAPQAWEQEEAAAQIGFSASAASPVNLGEAEADSVQICSFQAPQVANATYAYMAEVSVSGSAEVKRLGMNAKGEVSKAQLQELLVSAFGPKPEERVLSAVISAIVTLNGESMRASATPIEVKATPEAPLIESAYYVIGANNNWTWSDTSGKFSHSGKNVYEDPVFTVTIPAPVDKDGNRVDFWFKIAPQSVVDAGADGANVVGIAVNGDEALSGSLVSVGANAFKQPASDGAKYYKIQINMLEMTYSITPLSFGPYVYVPGGHQGWKPDIAPSLQLIDANTGYYEGFVYLTDEFKFTLQPSWGKEYNADNFTLADPFSRGGGSNIKIATPGSYMLKLNVTDGTLKAVPTVWGIIGSATPGGWDASTPMTVDPATGLWSIVVTLTDGAMKFRANDGWDIQVAGAIDNLVRGGGDMNVTGGKYKITLNLNDASHYYATFEAL